MNVSGLLFMDPISLTTGVLGLVATLSSILKEVDNIKQKYKEAPSVLKEISNECSITQRVVFRVQAILQQDYSDKPRSPDREELEACFATAVKELDNLIRGLLEETYRFNKARNSKIADISEIGLRQRTSIVWKESFLKEFLQKIRDHRSVADFVLNSIQL
jgi:hypothetical protein